MVQNLSAAFGLTVLLSSSLSSAQSAAEKAEAQVLFEEGRRLVEEGKLEEACRAFEGSQKADPAIGTLLNLADCYQRAGKTASAWATFEEVATKARRAEQAERTKIAVERAAELEGKLSKLTVEVAEPVEGLAIAIGGVPLASSLWGKATPTDPGELTVKAEAPGKKPWSTAVTLGAEADRQTVSVPPLEDLPDEPKLAGPVTPPPMTERPDDTAVMAQWVSGWSALGVGVAGGAVGAVLRVMALSKDDESFEHCSPNDPGVCTQEGADLRDQAQALQMGSVIAWAVGGAFAVTGVVLLVTTPSGEAEAAEAARLEWLANGGPGGASVGMRLHW